MNRKKIVIFGAGMTGLAAGRELARAGHQVEVFEASDHVGGLASTWKTDDGFTYDNGPRFIFSTLAEKIGIADDCERVQYYENLLVGGRYYRFPFGFIRNPLFCLSVGMAMLTRPFYGPPDNLKRFLQIYYGRTFSRKVLIPLIEKWAGIPADEISIDFASRLLPTNLSYIIYSFIKKFRSGITEDYYKQGRYIVYPRQSNAVIFQKLMQTPGVNVHLNSPLNELDCVGNRVSRVRIGDEWVTGDYFLSTIPITSLATLVDRTAASNIWNRFHYRGIMILFIKVNRPKVLNTLWTWFPEAAYRFYRISEYKNALPQMAPKDKTLISVEIGCEKDDPFWKSTETEVYERIRNDLEKLYGLTRSEIIGFDLKKSPCAYPVLKKATEHEQRSLVHQTPIENLFIAGRTGIFQYRMLEGSYESAMTCVETIKSAIAGEMPDAVVTADRDRYGRPRVVPD